MTVAAPVIEVSDLEFSYGLPSEKKEPLLRVSKFLVQANESVFLKGASGSGKTTLLGLITGVLTAQHGSVRVLGEEFSQISAAKRDAVRGQNMGYIFQMFNLIPYLSVRENIELPVRMHRVRRQKLKGASIESESKRLAQSLGIGELLLKPVSELSVGQQQRVAAARALIGSPKLIVADEPTSALDADHRQKFIELLMSECQREGASLLFVSHDQSLAKYFSRSESMSQISERGAL